MGRRALLYGAVLVAGLGVRGVGRAIPAVAEFYGASVFPAVSGTLSAISSVVPFAIAEWVLLAGGLAIVALTIRGLVRFAFREALARAAVAALGIAAAVACGDALLWGLNYDRRPLVLRAGWVVAPGPADELRALCEDLIEGTHLARAAVEEGEDGVMRLGDGRGDVLDRAPLGFVGARRALPALGVAPARRAKRFVLASPLMTRLGLSGVYMPFTGEPTVNGQVPDPSLPFTASHEIAHQIGIAREDEANFVGWLACRSHPDAAFRYAGHLAALGHALSALRRIDPAAARDLTSRLDPGVRRDREAIRAFWRAHAGAVMRAAERVNDTYLKSQGQKAGIESYGLVVDLMVAERRSHLLAPERGTGDEAENRARREQHHEVRDRQVLAIDELEPAEVVERGELGHDRGRTPQPPEVIEQFALDSRSFPRKRLRCNPDDRRGHDLRCEANPRGRRWDNRTACRVDEHRDSRHGT